MSRRPQTVDEYLASLAPDRRATVETVREVILENLPEGYEEGIQYGMICYYVPLSHYPNTYNGQPLGVLALASQKNYMALYFNCEYGDETAADWFRQEYKKTGKRLDMGKSCFRFKTLDEIPLDLLAHAVAMHPVDEYIAAYERVRG